MNSQEIMSKEIDLIQNCISRMAQNSFLVKGWTISLLAVIVALLPEKIDLDIRIFCVVSFAVTLCFWYLDGYFLKIARLYRWKYAWVIKNRLTTSDFAYDLNPHNSKTWIGGSTEPWTISVMFSKTVWPMYLLISVVELSVFMFSHFEAL